MWFCESDPHEEFPLRDEEFSGRQRAETLIHHDEEESAGPENTTAHRDETGSGNGIKSKPQTASGL